MDDGRPVTAGTPRPDQERPASDATAVPCPGGAAPRDGYPWQLGVAAALWLVLGAVLLGAGTGGGTGSAADPQQVDAITGGLGADTVAATAQHVPGTWWVVLGGAVLVLAGMLAIGQGWARYGLMVLGVLATATFVAAAAWEVFVALAVVVIASTLLLAPRAHRFLS